jgi:hypothetical protein
MLGNEGVTESEENESNFKTNSIPAYIWTPI